MLVIENRLNDLLAEKKAREHRRILIKDVARDCGVSRQNASKWFNNRVKAYSVEMMRVLCIYFECEASDLFVTKRREQTS